MWRPPPKKKAPCNADAYYLNARVPIREIVTNARGLETRDMTTSPWDVEPAQPGYATPTHAIVVQGHLSRGGILKDMETDLRVLCDVQFRMSNF